MKKYLSPLYALVVCLGLSFILFNCSNNKKSDSASESEQPAETVDNPPAPDTTVMDSTIIEETPVDTTETEETEEQEENEQLGEETPNASKTGSGLAARTVSEDRLAIILSNIAKSMEDQKLEYISAKGQDCSGIYHKIKDQIQRQIKELGDQSKYHYPEYTTDRNSRQIANWYHENGNLHIVQDGNKDRNLITPGTVVFFGRTEEQYSNITIDKLTNPGKWVHDGTNGKIMHVAVVTTVERDDDGNVIKYDMMHGRNSRNFASRTTANHDGPGSYAKKHAQFPFGNWNQQLVALAHIETPK